MQKSNIFQICSGLKLNLNKTEIIPIGRNANKTIILPENLKSIQIKKGPFKALGVWYSINEEESINLNFAERIKNIQQLTNIWSGRLLSLKGKIMILKTLVLPQIQFLLGMIYVQEKTLIEIDKIFFKFLWNGKPAKIKKTTIIAPVNEGGLGMIDIHAVHAAAKCSWLKRLYNPIDAKWKKSMWHMLNVNENILNKNYNMEICKGQKANFTPKFYSYGLKCTKPGQSAKMIYSTNISCITKIFLSIGKCSNLIFLARTVM